MEVQSSRRIAVVTDSTSDLPASLVEQYSIHVVPQTLIMGSQTWKDGVDINPPAFYRLLSESPDFPSTSQPTMAEFEGVFTRLGEQSGGVAAILVSDELSGTLDSARMAAAALPHLPIEIVDSRGASMQLGLMVLAAARAAVQGRTLTEVAAAARSLVGRVRVYFVVDTLEYLHRGGRIGAAARLFGSALNLKPVLQVADGTVAPLTRVRTRRKALSVVQSLLRERIGEDDRVRMAVLHVASPDEAASLADVLEQEFRPVELIQAECGPVIGTHVGPGTVGIAFYVG